MMVPPNTPKWSFLVGKPMVVGYHYFRKHLRSDDSKTCWEKWKHFYKIMWHTLPETNIAPDKGAFPKGNDRIPTIHFQVLLLMDKIPNNHQKHDEYPIYLQGFIHSRWLFGISSINSRVGTFSIRFKQAKAKIDWKIGTPPKVEDNTCFRKQSYEPTIHSGAICSFQGVYHTTPAISCDLIRPDAAIRRIGGAQEAWAPKAVHRIHRKA